MAITKTVDIPSNRLINDPNEVPTGKVALSFTPMTEIEVVEFADASAEEVMTAGDRILDKHIAAFKALAN